MDQEDPARRIGSCFSVRRRRPVRDPALCNQALLRPPGWTPTRIKKAIVNLERFPGAGHAPPEPVTHFLEIIAAKNRVIYEVVGDIVYIHIICDCRQDFKTKLARRPCARSGRSDCLADAAMRAGQAADNGTAPRMSTATVRALPRHIVSPPCCPIRKRARVATCCNLTQHLARRQGRQVFGDVYPDRSSSSSSICSRFLPVHRMIPSGAALARLAFVPVQPAQIQLHLALVRRLEVADLQFDGDQTPQLAVVEQQIRWKSSSSIGCASAAPGRKSRARFQQEGFRLADDRAFQVAFLPAVLQAQEVQDIRVAHHQRR